MLGFKVSVERGGVVVAHGAGGGGCSEERLELLRTTWGVLRSLEVSLSVYILGEGLRRLYRRGNRLHGIHQEILVRVWWRI